MGRTGSIALIERVWRTLKDLTHVVGRPALHPDDLTRRLETGLLYYAYVKPHDGLGGAVPAEAFFGLPPAHRSARPPARARPRAPTDPPLTVAFLDDERCLPVLIPLAA